MSWDSSCVSTNTVAKVMNVGPEEWSVCRDVWLWPIFKFTEVKLCAFFGSISWKMLTLWLLNIVYSFNTIGVRVGRQIGNLKLLFKVTEVKLWILVLENNLITEEARFIKLGILFHYHKDWVMTLNYISKSQRSNSVLLGNMWTNINTVVMKLHNDSMSLMLGWVTR